MLGWQSNKVSVLEPRANIMDAANKRRLPAVGERRVNQEFQDLRETRSRTKADMVEMVKNGDGFDETFDTTELW